MKGLLDELFYKSFDAITQRNNIIDLDEKAAQNKNRIKKNMSKKQKKLLLRLSDYKDLKTEQCSYESFIAGFKAGLKLGYEANKD